jgi:hypothetical protein
LGFFSNLFGKGKEKAPEIKVPTAEELFQSALGQARGAFPKGFEAREFAAGELAQPFAGIQPIDFSQFQPTTFEQGLTGAPFGNLLEQAQRQALQIGSLSGIPSAAPAHFGRAIAPTIMNIGQFLAQQGQQRGMAELERRLQEEQLRQNRLQLGLGAAPENLLMPLTQMGGQQAAAQSAADLLNYQQREAQLGGGSALLSLLGGGLGFALGGPIGAGIGAAGAGTIGSLLGGGESPVGFQDVALLNLLGGGGGFGLGNLGIGAGQEAQNLFGLQQFGQGGGLGDLLGRAVPVGDTSAQALRGLAFPQFPNF